jgi:hypothetical protein
MGKAKNVEQESKYSHSIPGKVSSNKQPKESTPKMSTIN